MAPRSRLHMNDQRLSNALEFASVENFHEWLSGRLVQQYFTFFETHTQRYKTDIKGRKGNEFRTIQRLIATGESGGKQIYSRDIVEEDMASWSLDDHQARLIYKLVSVNSDNFRGPFYGKNLPKAHKESLMWDVYLRHIWKQSPSKHTTTNIKRPTHHQTSKSSSYSEHNQSAIINSPSTIEDSARFKIIWENVSDEAEPSAFGCIITIGVTVG